MKTKLTLAIALLFAAVAHAATTNRIFLTWDLLPEYDTNTTFYVYSQTNPALPAASWTHSTNISFQSFTSAVRRVEIPVASENARYYTYASSNLFGLSDFADPVISRRLPTGTGLRIGAF